MSLSSYAKYILLLNASWHYIQDNDLRHSMPTVLQEQIIFIFGQLSGFIGRSLPCRSILEIRTLLPGFLVYCSRSCCFHWDYGHKHDKLLRLSHKNIVYLHTYLHLLEFPFLLFHVTVNWWSIRRRRISVLYWTPFVTMDRFKVMAWAG